MSDATGQIASYQPPPGNDVLTLQVGNQLLSGWQRLTVTRSMDAIPASFDLEVTERFPDSPDIDIRAGQPCTVRIGGDLVLTGYVDRYAAQVSPSQHTIHVSGRSKSEDLVDCAAFTGSSDNVSMQVKGGTALAIAQAIAKPYGVTITSLAGDGHTIPQFNINLGESCWDVIDRLIRVSGFVAYDLPDGSVVFARAGTDKMASGFAIGANVEQADISYSLDGRFSEYEGHFLSVITYGVEGPLTNTAAGPIARDAGVPRFRKRFVVSEQMSDGVSLAGQRAQWECNRNAGRSQQLNVVADSWRDSAGKLWEPNHLAPISAAVLKLANASWVIAGVSYVRDENGQHTAVTLMPVEAFSPEPIALLPIPALVQDVEAHNPTKATPADTSVVQT